MKKELVFYTTKHWLGLLEEYELVKRKESSRFKTCKEFYEFYDTSAKQVLKYRAKYLESGKSEDSLLPNKRGPKLWTRRTPKGIERNIVKAYRKLGLNRYELVALFEPIYKEETPRESTMGLIVRRYQKGLPDQVKTAIKRYERKYPGELAHIDSYYLPKSTLKSIGMGRGFLCGIMDDCTRLAYTEVLPNIKSATVAGFFGRGLSFFYRSYGIRFDEVMTDNGSEFVGKEFKFLAEYLGIKQIRIQPHHPQTNGKIEAFWKIVNREFLSPNRYINEQDLVDNLGMYLHKFNHERRHGGIKYITPFEKFKKVSKIVTELLD